MEKRNYIPAPIDNKNLVEDAFEDATEIFGDFYDGKDHHVNGQRHLVGLVQIYDEEFPKCVNAEGYVEVWWKYGGNAVTIKVLANNPCMEDYEETCKDIFDYYKKQFKSWECESNPGLVVEFEDSEDSLFVAFYWNLDDPYI